MKAVDSKVQSEKQEAKRASVHLTKKEAEQEPSSVIKNAASAAVGEGVAIAFKIVPEDASTSSPPQAGNRETAANTLTNTPPPTDLRRDPLVLPDTDSTAVGAIHVSGPAQQLEEIIDDDISNDENLTSTSDGGDEASWASNSTHQAEAVVTTAVPVTDPEITREEMEAEIRQSIMNEAVQAAVVMPSETTEADVTDRNKWTLRRWCSIGIVAMLMVGVVVGISAGVILSKVDDKNGIDTAPPALDIVLRPTLEAIQERGRVKCLVNAGFVGFTSVGQSGMLEGINVDHCRALSIAVFGNPDQFELVDPPGRNSIEYLHDGTVDVVAQFQIRRMKTDIYDSGVDNGATFSVPYFFSGFGFMGADAMVDCAERLDIYSRECRALRLCVVEGTVNESTLQELLPGGVVVSCATAAELNQNFVAGECNVIAAQAAAASEERFRNNGYTGDFTIGRKRFTLEELALISRDNDPEWAATINLVLHTFFLAEAHNVRQGNSEDIRLLFHGNEHNSPTANTMVAIVAQFGNYNDLYQRHLDPVVPRQGYNLLYSKSDATGLLYSLTFDDVDNVGPGPVKFGTLDSTLSRGHLRCGVRSGPMLSANQEDKWKGLHEELCKAVAAALFAGNASAVVFVAMSESGGHTLEDDWELLTNGAVDVLAGSPISIKPTLGDDSAGFAFGPAYFTDPNNMRQYALMTRAGDSQWIAFIYWITMAIVYAEEEGITQSDFYRMPITLLFGEVLKLCFQDAVSAVGSYAELYARTMEATLPRSGANMLNRRGNGTDYGPQHFAVPFY